MHSTKTTNYRLSEGGTYLKKQLYLLIHEAEAQGMTLCRHRSKLQVTLTLNIRK